MFDIGEEFKKTWNTTGNKFTPTYCEWLAWIGQPMLYDGGYCVNRTPEEREVSQQIHGSLLLS